jgi:prophage regulatory protein
MAKSLAEDLAKNGLYGLEHRGGRQVDTFLRLEDVKRATGLSRSTIYELISADPPRFPKPVKILDGGKAVAWLSSEIAEWQRQRIAARDNAEAA